MNKILTKGKIENPVAETKNMESAKGCGIVTNFGAHLDQFQLMVATGSFGLYLDRAQKYYDRERRQRNKNCLIQHNGKAGLLEPVFLFVSRKYD